MKTINLSAAACAVALSTFAIVAPAQAQSMPDSQGHYEWQASPQFGPRATLRAPVRVWVPAERDVAAGDCAMMRAQAPDCMSGKAAPGNG